MQLSFLLLLFHGCEISKIYEELGMQTRLLCSSSRALSWAQNLDVGLGCPMVGAALSWGCCGPGRKQLTWSCFLHPGHLLSAEGKKVVWLGNELLCTAAHICSSMSPRGNALEEAEAFLVRLRTANKGMGSSRTIAASRASCLGPSMGAAGGAGAQSGVLSACGSPTFVLIASAVTLSIAHG